VIKKEQGTMIGSIFRDISKLKETEQQLKEHLMKMEMLNRVIMASNKAENTSTLLEEILNSILEVMNLDGGGIYLINESTKSASLIYHRGLKTDVIKFVGNVQIEDKEYRSVFIDGNTILAENLPILNAKMAKISGFSFTISIPLFSKERIIGALNIGSKRRYTISEIEKDIFKSLSREVGTAISKMQSEEALRKSEAMYREAYNRAEFYKDILAHDINNILQSILTTTDLSTLIVKRGENIDDLINLFNDLKIQVDRGAKLVLNVRTLSKIENVPLSLNQLEVSQVLNDVIKKLSQGYQKNVKIQLDSQNSTFLVHANELLVEVFENILINAIRHNNNPQIEIIVRISKYQENKKDYVKIEFIDNGMGIEDSQKDVIFQRGYEEGKSTSGMGLGLSLVKKILQIYDGKIWVEDRVKGNPSGGSNFIVLIPEVE
jgi:signal transduction histidine kinase